MAATTPLADKQPRSRLLRDLSAARKSQLLRLGFGTGGGTGTNPGILLGFALEALSKAASDVGPLPTTMQMEATWLRLDFSRLPAAWEYLGADNTVPD